MPTLAQKRLSQVERLEQRSINSSVSPFIVLSVFEGRSAGRDIGEQISCLMLSPYLESVLMLLLSSE